MCIFNQITCELKRKWCLADLEDLHLARKKNLLLNKSKAGTSDYSTLIMKILYSFSPVTTEVRVNADNISK